MLRGDTGVIHEDRVYEDEEEQGRRQRSSKGIDAWLERVKAGYGARFVLMFQAMGIEDLDDVRDMSEARLVQLRLVLRKGGAKPIQLDRINDAMDKIRLGVPPHKCVAMMPRRPASASRRGRRPRSARPHRRTQQPSDTEPPAARLLVLPAKKITRPQRPQSAPASGRNVVEQEVTEQSGEQRVKEAPPIVMQRSASGGWEPRDDSRREVLSRLVRHKQTDGSNAKSAAEARAPSKPLRVAKNATGDFPYAWELTSERKKVWDRLLRPDTARQRKKRRSTSPRPFVSPGPNSRTSRTISAAGAQETVKAEEPFVVEKRGNSWAWAIDDRRRDVWDRLLALPRTKSKRHESKSTTSRPAKVVSVQRIQLAAQNQTGLFKPLRVNGEHVSAREVRERVERERRSSRRFQYVNARPPPAPRKFPLDVLLKSWTIEQIRDKVAQAHRRLSSAATVDDEAKDTCAAPSAPPGSPQCPSTTTHLPHDDAIQHHPGPPAFVTQPGGL